MEPRRDLGHSPVAAEAPDFRVTVDSLPGMVYTMTAQGALEFVNKRILEFAGKVREDLNDWAPLLHPEDRDRIVDQWSRSVETGKPFDEEFRVQAADGTYGWFQSRGAPIRDTEGRIVRWYFLLTDVHRQKHAEQALHESELNLRLVVDAIPDMAIQMSADGELEFCNHRLLEYYGKSFAEMKYWPSVCHPEDKQATIEAWMHAVRTGEDFDVEVRVRRADGVYRWIRGHVVPLKNWDGKVLRWYGLLTDIDEGKRAQDALQASELNFRSIVETIPGMLYTMTADGDLEFTNAQITEYFGKSLEEMKEFFGNSFEVMKDWGGIMHPEDQQVAQDHWMHSLRTGEPYDHELRAKRADGVHRWHRAHVVPVSVNGKVFRWYGLLTDIDDRKRAQEVLQASELHFRSIVETVPGMLYTMTPDGELEFNNARVAEFFGSSLEERKDWAWVSSVHPEDRQRTIDAWMDAVGTGEAYDQEVRVLRADGVYRWLRSHIVPLKDAHGMVLRWYGLITDIDDRKRVQEILLASEMNFRSIIETIPGLVHTMTKEGELEFINARVKQFFGRSLEELREWAWVASVHPDDREGTIDAWMRAVKTGEGYDREVRVRRADGVYRWLRSHIVPLKDAEGIVVRWYGLITDIDERIKLDEMIRGTQERLARASKAATLGELSASIAHEVGQPLAAVVANGDACLGWLSANPPNIAKAVAAAERVTRDGKEAGDIVQRIRTLFKRTSFEKLRLNLHDVIGEVLSLVRMEISRRKVTLETELSEGQLEVVGDRVQLQQLLLNLFLNALDAMEPVTDRPRVLSVRTARLSDEVLVEVSDSGIGIAAPDKIFETFFTTKPNGMGMGLAICRSIVEAHGGRIWASSKAEPGAILCVSLPEREAD